MIHTTVVARYTPASHLHTWMCSSRNQFVPEPVRPMTFLSRLVLHILSFFFFFFKLSSDKCHTSAFNALIFFPFPFFFKIFRVSFDKICFCDLLLVISAFFKSLSHFLHVIMRIACLCRFCAYLNSSVTHLVYNLYICSFSLSGNVRKALDPSDTYTYIFFVGLCFTFFGVFFKRLYLYLASSGTNCFCIFICI